MYCIYNLRAYLQHVYDIYVLLTAHLVTVFVNNQPDAQFFFTYVYFYSLRVSHSYVSIIRRINCINTTSGMSFCVGDLVVCIPEGHGICHSV